MGIIDNSDGNTLADSLDKILPNCNQIDILVGYFFFSGYQEMYQQLSDKKIRILVGLEVDSKVVGTINNLDEEGIGRLPSKRGGITISSQAKKAYYEMFSNIFNKTDIFDNEEVYDAFESFLSKIKDGTLEIKKTKNPEHGKFYLLHFNENATLGGTTPGFVIEGSSNLTFNGLKGQGEHNRILREPHYFNDDKEKFEILWNQSDNITIADQSSYNDFKKEIKSRLWLYALPKPYDIFLRVLIEYFSLDDTSEKINTPSKITGGKFSDYKYQVDAISFGVDRINKFGGVIVADVVGLGKSIIASAIASNLGLKTIVIAPPHLIEQWEEYKFEFGFNALVYSSGGIEKALDKHGNEEDLLIILDEAHKHRNEETENYKFLHRLCAGNKVLALSATPFNNDPKDIYALIKLFDTPGQSIIRTVENLSIEFRLLIDTYKKLRRDLRGKKGKDTPDESKIKKKAEEIANKLRYMISPIVIRRSRLDIEKISEYKLDLENQGVSFAKVHAPVLFEYDLKELSEIYIETLNKISPDDLTDGEKFEGARYQTVSYVRPGSLWVEKIKDEFDIANLGVVQKQIAKIMRRLLVRRFESSVASFKSTLVKMIQNSEDMLRWYQERKEVPVYKKGGIISFDSLDDMDNDELEEYFLKLEDKGMIRIPVSEIDPNFEKLLIQDIEILNEVYNDWFDDNGNCKFEDYKFNFFIDKIKTSLNNEPERKIIVFTEFSDTANYIYKMCEKSGLRVFKYSSEDAKAQNKEIIRKNFDAGYSNQSNDFDILIATDAISEGFNLHRAGTIVNYDIPYNPTRVIQRIGRINRINKKVFEELFIYNFFPTATGEKETKTKAIATLKMNLIHSLLGGDTKVFTDEEELKSYFADSYKEKESEMESESWDAKYRDLYNKVKSDEKLYENIINIPYRSRIGRENNKNGVLAFGKKGASYIFAYGKDGENIEHITPELGISLFNANIDDKSIETNADFYPIYKSVKDYLFKKNTHPPIKGRRQDADTKLEIIGNLNSEAFEYCELIRKIIYELDALPEGILKEISQLKLKKDNLDDMFKRVMEIVPVDYIEKLLGVGEKNKGDEEYILLTEQFLG